MTNDVFGIYILNHVLKKDMTFSFRKIKYMNLKQKNKQSINYGNRIAAKTLKYIGEGFIKFSTWKFNSITLSMRSSYNNGLKLHKQEIK